MTKSLVYLRKDLRLHDNVALQGALSAKSDTLTPIFILDSTYLKSNLFGINRAQFLIESLLNLNQNLMKHGSRLLVVRGDPLFVLPLLYKSWGITNLYYETSIEHSFQVMDDKITKLSKDLSVDVESVHGHTLYDPIAVVKKNANKAPLTYVGFQKIVGTMTKPPRPTEIADDFKFPPITDIKECVKVEEYKLPKDEYNTKSFDSICMVNRAKLFSKIGGTDQSFGIPTLSELGFTDEAQLCPYKGGETVALEQLDEYCKDSTRVSKYEKPKTSPSEFKPASTTVLSAHLKYGTLSCRLFYHRIMDIYASSKSHTEPPMSLLGQLLWREFFYCVNFATPSFGAMKGNPVSLQIPWFCADGIEDVEHPVSTKNLVAWKNAETGFPWIDAIMTQLRQEGWIHHLARHSVACFLTRGDLWISWERGVEVFEELLIDHDSPLNEGNWMWLSASAFYHTYFRVYSPVAFGKKYDTQGEYIKKYLPVLKKMPQKYLFEPWKAPLSVQKEAKCIIGVDYPMKIVDHEIVVKENMEKMKAAYANGQKGVVDGHSYYGPLSAPFVKVAKTEGKPAKKQKLV